MSQRCHLRRERYTLRTAPCWRSIRYTPRGSSRMRDTSITIRRSRRGRARPAASTFGTPPRATAKPPLSASSTPPGRGLLGRQGRGLYRRRDGEARRRIYQKGSLARRLERAENGKKRNG